MSTPLAQMIPRAVADDDLLHLVECHDDNLTLCGLDATDVPWVDDGLPCVVCTDLDRWHCGCECGCCDGDDA
jgi:hypothetical protein